MSSGPMRGISRSYGRQGRNRRLIASSAPCPSRPEVADFGRIGLRSRSSRVFIIRTRQGGSDKSLDTEGSQFILQLPSN